MAVKNNQKRTICIAVLCICMILNMTSCIIRKSTPSMDVSPSVSPMKRNNIAAVTLNYAGGPSDGYYYTISDENILYCYKGIWQIMGEGENWSNRALNPREFLTRVKEQERISLTQEQAKKILDMADEINRANKKSGTIGLDIVRLGLFYNGKTYEENYSLDPMLDKLISYIMKLSPLKEESDPNIQDYIEVVDIDET